MSRAWHCLAALLVLLAFCLFVDAKLWRPKDFFGIHENIQIAEAQAWWKGRLDLPERKWDSALYKGKVYSHFPPLFSFLSALIVPFFKSVPHWFVLVIVALPLPILSYLVCRRFTESAVWSAILAIGLVCGTSALPVLEMALRGAGPYFVNQALALTGLLIFLREYFGRQRFLVAGVGVVFAVWSRQMSVAYLLPLGWMTRNRSPQSTPLCALGPVVQCPPLARGEARSRGLSWRPGIAARMGLVVAFALGVPMGLNWLKFDNPLESGYMLVYEGRHVDLFAKDARAHGIFSTHYISRNLYYMNVGFPKLERIEQEGRRVWYFSTKLWGAGIWWTTPFLFFVFFDLRRILSDPQRRMLLAAACLAYIGLLVYHSTGYKQRGYNRYSLDYLPALFVLAAPAALATPRRKLITVCLIAWSVFYFAGARQWPQLRVW